MPCCVKCNEGFGKEEAMAICNVCQDTYHVSLECAGISPTEMKVLNLKVVKPLLVYKCVDCTANGGQSKTLTEYVIEMKETLDNNFTSVNTSLASLKSNVQDLTLKFNDIQQEVNKIPQMEANITLLQDDLAKLKAEVDSHNTGVMNTNLDNNNNSNLSYPVANTSFMHIEKMLSEMQDRKRRAKNIIIYSCPEQGKANKNQDIVNISNFLKNAKISTVLTSANTKRLGKYQAGIVRPVCVTMDNRADVIAVLTNWKLLPNTFKVSGDYTKLQREQYKKLKEEANRYNESKPIFKKYVRFSKGNPELCTESIASVASGGTSSVAPSSSDIAQQSLHSKKD